jgi:16S rRNA (guanine527-N7)-methyltransferase
LNLDEQLKLGAKHLSLDLTEEQLEQLVELQHQLMKWTKAFNLTAITDEQEVLKLHLLDSLAVVAYWKQNSETLRKTLDVGTGAGFPGLPLAIALPEQTFHLLDSNSKKIRFIRQQIHQLGLKNVTAFHSRVQQHEINDYDAITSRAFASINDMVLMTEPLLKPGGVWLAMKAQFNQQESDELSSNINLDERIDLTVPWLNAERCLIKLSRLSH